MQKNNLKNIVVLRNLPSNLIDEAIVVLKSNKYARKLQLAEKNLTSQYEGNEVTDDYVIKEAENVISNFIAKTEKKNDNKKSNNNIEMKYKKIKAYSVFVSILLVLFFATAII